MSRETNNSTTNVYDFKLTLTFTNKKWAARDENGDTGGS